MKNPSKKVRLTLNKQIAAASTRAQKWEIALLGGRPPSAIQNLPSQAFVLRGPSLHGEDWRANAIKQTKQHFADLLFPALLNDNPKPFQELLEAMASRRKREVSLENFVGQQCEGLRKKPTKKEMGRRLRLALLNLSPDDLLSMHKVLTFLADRQIEFSDESHVRRVMRELHIHLLKHGDTVYFGWSNVDVSSGNPKRWKCVRKLTVEQNGKTTNVGLSRRQYDDLLGWKAHTVQPAISDK